MKIAVDARPLSYSMVGITRYTHELITRLLYSPHEWFLYLYEPPIHPLPDLPNVHVRVAPVRMRGMGTFFAQSVFSIWAIQDSIDVFWSPRHHLPQFLTRNIKTLVTVHDLVWQTYPETMTRAGAFLESVLMPRAIRKSDHIITVSNTIKAEIVASFPLAAEKISTVYSGASLKRCPVRECLGAPYANKPYFLFVGTLEPRKNLSRLISAFSEFNTHNPDLKLVLVGGEGWGGEQLHQIIESHGLAQSVILTERVSEQELAQYYAGCRALVIPSLYEGFGLPALEAMTFGAPVLVSEGGATAEIAGEAAVKVDPICTHSIANGLLKLADDEVHTKLSLEAENRASLFSWDKAAAKTLQLLETL